MKKTLIFILIIIAAYLLWTAIQTKPEEIIQEAVVSENTGLEESDSDDTIIKSDYLDVAISFTGFGPGKKHTGSFSGVESKLTVDAGGVLGGEVVVDMNTLSTDTEAVTKHLKTDAFFDTTKFPTATFTLSRVEGGTAFGSMNIHGVTKAISFPITDGTDSWTSTFTLDMKDFGINQTFANETIELSVVVKK